MNAARDVSRAVFAFTRDLRLDDHAGLAAAARYGAVVPVLVIDQGCAARLRRSPRRAANYCAAVEALDAALRERGTRLIVRRGPSAAVLRAIARAVGASVVVWSCGYDPAAVRADRDLQSKLEEAGLRALPTHDAPALAPEDAAVSNHRGDGYRAFVPYHARWRELVPQPSAGSAEFVQTELSSEALPTPAEFGSSCITPCAATKRQALPQSRSRTRNSPKKCGHTPFKRLIPAADMAEKIRVACAARQHPETMIIARTDARQSEGLEGALHRAELYRQAGADILFVEALPSETEMRQACAAIAAPMMANMADGGLTPILPARTLAELGYAFAIYPAMTSLAAAHAMEAALKRLKAEGISNSPDAPLFDFKTFCSLIGFDGVWAFEREWAPKATQHG